MSVNLNDLGTGVRIYLDESSAADFLDSEVIREINYKYMEVVGEVMQVYEDYYETTTPIGIAMVANQQEYPVDSSLIKITRVEINFSPNVLNSKPVRATRANMDEIFNTLVNTTVTGGNFNVAYYLHGPQDSQFMGFVPTPTTTDTGSTKSISIWGIQSPATLVNGTDTAKIPYPDRFGKLIEIGAAGELLSKGQQDEANGTKYLNRFAAGIIEMRAFLKERLSDGPDMVRDAELVDMDFETINSFGF